MLVGAGVFTASMKHEHKHIVKYDLKTPDELHVLERGSLAAFEEGPDGACSRLAPGCVAVVECGWPLVFSDYWARAPCPNGEPVTSIPSDWGLAYQFFEESSTLLPPLNTTIRALHRMCVIRNTFSMGMNHGEYLGRNQTSSPAAARRARNHIQLFGRDAIATQ